MSQMPRELKRIRVKSLEILGLEIGDSKRGGRASPLLRKREAAFGNSCSPGLVRAHEPSAKSYRDREEWHEGVVPIVHRHKSWY